MTDDSPVCAPGEAFPFDFWSWRQTRRMLVDKMLSLVHARIFQGRRAAALQEIALGMERETLTHDDVEGLSRLLSVGHMETGLDLFAALEAATPAGTEVLPFSTRLYRPLPDWSKSLGTASRPFVFDGTVGGIQLRASLSPSRDATPPHQIVYHLSPYASATGGQTVPLGARQPMSSVPETADVLWDWLLARRLSWLCQQGFLKWPAESKLVLDTTGFVPLPKKM